MAAHDANSGSGPTCCVAAGQVRGLSRCFAAMYGQTEAGRGPQVGARMLVILWNVVNC